MENQSPLQLVPRKSWKICCNALDEWTARWRHRAIVASLKPQRHVSQSTTKFTSRKQTSFTPRSITLISSVASSGFPPRLRTSYATRHWELKGERLNSSSRTVLYFSQWSNPDVKVAGIRYHHLLANFDLLSGSNLRPTRRREGGKEGAYDFTAKVSGFN